jgi:hypothetical protein
LLILIIMIPILVAVGIAVTGILGFIGGKIGGVTQRYLHSRSNMPPQSPLPTTPQSSTQPSLTSCLSCNVPIHTSDAHFCPSCGTAIPKMARTPVISVIHDNTA